jgi:hypothetical protein
MPPLPALKNLCPSWDKSSPGLLLVLLFWHFRCPLERLEGIAEMKEFVGFDAYYPQNILWNQSMPPLGSAPCLLGTCRKSAFLGALGKLHHWKKSSLVCCTPHTFRICMRKNHCPICASIRTQAINSDWATRDGSGPTRTLRALISGRA